MRWKGRQWKLCKYIIFLYEKKKVFRALPNAWFFWPRLDTFSSSSVTPTLLSIIIVSNFYCFLSLSLSLSLSLFVYLSLFFLFSRVCVCVCLSLFHTVQALFLSLPSQPTLNTSDFCYFSYRHKTINGITRAKSIRSVFSSILLLLLVVWLID